jgi:ATP-dependent Zn protease
VTDAANPEHDVDTAYHEASHAVVGCLLGRPPVYVTIVREGPVAGKTEYETGVPAFARRHFDQSPEKRRYAEQRILSELGGSRI